MTSIREKLAALRNIAREGGTIDLAEFVSLENQAAAQDRIAALGAEGEAARVAEKAARERDARRAQAAGEVRETVNGARDELDRKYAALLATIAEVDAAVATYNEAITTARNTLGTAGYASYNAAAPGPRHPEHPDYDPALHPILNSGGGASVHIDGIDRLQVDTGNVVHYAAEKAGLTKWFHDWKHNNNSYPIPRPFPGVEDEIAG